MKKLTVVSILIVIFAMLLGACAPRDAVVSGAASSDAETQRTINVTGAGEVYLTPDIGYVTVGTHVENENVSDAVNESNQLTDDIVAALTKEGIAEKDIQTSSFNVYLQDKWISDSQPTVKTYMVENMLSITVRDLDVLGKVLEAALNAGANAVYNIQFDVADKSEALENARRLAVENAAVQAEQFANAADVELGEMISISASSGTTIMPLSMGGYGMGGGAAMDMVEESVPVSSGQIVVRVSASVLYEIGE
ncbi:MAG: SIMPL domain-containing protein [Anaerolineaceae bacterium]|nr:SIMPL domain-containing protein [Anaerolineaceae bacterium]